jgi:hypothetical protein
VRGMLARALCLTAVLAALVVPQAGAAEPLATLQVPTGGFSVDLPKTWVGITSAVPAAIARLEKVPAFKGFAQSGALKLIAADPATKGAVYMDTGAERIGAISIDTLGKGTHAAIKKGLGKQAVVTVRKVQLQAGPAYVIHVTPRSVGGTNESDEYVLLHDQVEYVIVYVAPTKSWKKYAPIFDQSAKSFRFLPGPNLDKLVLQGSQIAHGYKLAAYPGGSSFIGETTLDLCAGTYPSENLRTGRLQVRYTHPVKSVDISNEIVTYVAGGAQQALAEVSKVAQTCATKAVIQKRGAVTTTFQATAVHDPKLPPGTVAVKLVIKQTAGKKHITQTGIAIYQVKGDTLSGVYTFATKGTTFADVQRVAFHAAEQSARNLGIGKKKSGSGFTA